MLKIYIYFYFKPNPHRGKLHTINNHAIIEEYFINGMFCKPSRTTQLVV